MKKLSHLNTTRVLYCIIVSAKSIIQAAKSSMHTQSRAFTDFLNAMPGENIIEKPLYIILDSIFHYSTLMRSAYGAMTCNLVFNCNLGLVKKKKKNVGHHLFIWAILVTELQDCDWHLLISSELGQAKSESIIDPFKQTPRTEWCRGLTVPAIALFTSCMCQPEIGWINCTKPLITAYNFLSYCNPFPSEGFHFLFNLFTEIQSTVDHNLFTLGEKVCFKYMKASHYLSTHIGLHK